MSFRTRLMAALVAAAAVPVALALLISDAALADELLIAGVTIGLAVLAAVVLGIVLARPLRRVARDAEAVARGEWSTSLAPGTDEVGRVAGAIQALAVHLRSRQQAIDASRDDVRRSVQRLGEVLRSTHDLSKLLSVVLETALVAVGGKAGAVFLFSSRRSELSAKVARHVDPILGERRIPVGHGLAGWVAQHGRSVLLPSPDPDAPSPTDPEPLAQTAIAVPLESASQVLGVLAIYDSPSGDRFTPADMETLESLARQAAIGIDNVLLHQEAQRLSITDGLTSIWNHRYFQMRFNQEFASAKRFAQHMSLLWVDLDNFKIANDTFGHQRGDAILIELASRLSSQLREVDTLARYGGEEFIVILPHIDREGAEVAAERVRAIVADTPFGTEGEEPIDVTISVGYATYPDDGATQDSLLNAADKAMYVAKSRGKNAVVGAHELHGDE